MTTVSAVIKDALRETNLIGLGETPTTDEYAEGLTRLQAIVSSMLGCEAGENLSPLILCDDTPYIPSNSRVILSLTESREIDLDPCPRDGARLSVVDIDNNLSTNNFILNGNGRTIEGATTLTLATDGLNRDWFYRDDLGDWVRIVDLTLEGEMPFPKEFDDLFVTMLSMRLNPRNGQKLSGESLDALRRSKRQFQARYRQIKEVGSEDGLIRLAANRFDWAYNFNWGRRWNM